MGHWTITWQGTEHSSDDFTLEELGATEKASGTPWSVSNPLREVTVARAWLAVVLVRGGMDDAEVAAQLDTLTLGRIKDAFAYVADDTDIPVGEDTPAPLVLSSATSSSGVSDAGSGHRKKRAASA